ncbi:GntR family transcriptional regulator [Streptomyces sp. NPDC049954]|uniref:GntR family transcriptional regulator n=1 Tax=Streptomyces sp. NPDC049954 TaxID=3155779 RepID=UPI003437D995
MALPKYEQIATDLRGRIVRGELEAGEPLPSERELIERWSVARATVVKALSVLRQEQLIETRHGVGSTVRARIPLARTAGERYETALATGHVYTAGEHAQIIAADLAPAPDHVATGLGIETGDRIARRQRVTFEGETPVATSTSYFTAAVAEAAPRLLLRERVREGTTRYVEQETGRRPHTGRDWWSSRLATDEELELLQLEGPAAVTEVRHNVYDTEGAPLAYEVGVSPAGRWSRSHEYPMSH